MLRLLATDLDGPAIARELVVSLNTVRTHTKHIYAKLGVTNRRAAVSRAHQLRLLGPAGALRITTSITTCGDDRSPGRLLGPSMSSTRQPTAYEIRVHGRIDGRWSAWFDGLAIVPDGRRDTLIRGDVADQAALHGLLEKVRDLGLTLLSVTQVRPEGRP